MQIFVEKGSGKGSVFRLHDGTNTIGRDIGNRIRLLDPRVSRCHCKIRKVGRSLFVIDLGTRNGTHVNGELITEREREIGVGDRIVVGATVLRVADEEHEPEFASRQPSAPSLFRAIATALFSRKKERATNGGPDGSYKFVRKGNRALWKPRANTDSPEGRRTTVISTDPD